MSAVLKTADDTDYWNLPIAPGKPSPAELADYCFQHYPAISHAIQPPPLPRIDGQFSFDAEKEFALMAERVAREGVKHRIPATDDANLHNFGSAIGGCLEPALLTGDFHYSDPTIEPADGDFVHIVWSRDYYNDRIAGGHFDHWMERFGQRPGPIACKWLRRMGPYWLLVTNVGASYLTDWKTRQPIARILGVVRKTIRGVDNISPAACVSEVTNNAVAVVHSASDAGPVSVTTVLGGGNVSAWIKKVNFTPSVDCDLELKVVCQLDTNTSLTDALVFARVERISSPFTVQSIQQTVNTTTAAGTGIKIPIAINLNASLLGGVNYDCGLYLTTVDGAGVGNTNTARNIYVSAVEVKR